MWSNIVLSMVLINSLFTLTDQLEEGVRVKKTRASVKDIDIEVPQHLDEGDVIDDDVTSTNKDVAPPGFISPSVKEYLELGKSIPGRAGTDYPILGVVPYTNFYCDDQSYPGFFADLETRCQVWHYCDIDGRQASFLCPNGTIFSQAVVSCDWWFNVSCKTSPLLYQLNARLYRSKKSRRKPTTHRSITKQLLDEIFL